MVQWFSARILELTCPGFKSQLSIRQMRGLRGITALSLPQLCLPCNRGANSTGGWGEAKLASYGSGDRAVS